MVFFVSSDTMHLRIVLVLVAILGSSNGLLDPPDLQLKELPVETFVKPATKSFDDELKKGTHNLEQGASFITKALSLKSTFPPLCIPRSECKDHKSNNTSLPLCSLPAEELISGRLRPGNVHHDFLPPWVNLTLARQGQAFAKKNRFSITMAGRFGLVIGLAAPDASNVLAFTRNSDTKDRATRRYVATTAQMFVWFDEHFSDEKKDNMILESIANVRTMHKRAARSAGAAPRPLVPPNNYEKVETDDKMWEAVVKDLNDSPLVKYKDSPENYTKCDSTAVPMNQLIQGLTVWGFMGHIMMDPESVYIWDATEEDLRAFLHLWAVISYMMGVEDDYNVALQPTVAAAAQMARDCQNMFSVPGFFRMEKTTRVLMEALAIGLDLKGANLGLRRVMYTVLRDMFKIPANNTRATFTPAEELAQTNWDQVFVPSSRLPTTKLLMNEGFQTTFTSVRTGMFGLHGTPGEIAKNVFYPSAPTPTTEEEQQKL